MPKFLAIKKITQEVELVIEANSAEEAKALAESEELKETWDRTDFSEDYEELEIEPL